MSDKKLWLLKRTDLDGDGDDYEQYVAAVVCAETEAEAKLIHPRQSQDDYSPIDPHNHEEWRSWPLPDKINAFYLGVADPTMSIGCILADYFGS